jgi:mono/diheme cytochrome c family protein
VLPVAAFIAFWVVVGASVFYVAVSGSSRAAPERTRRASPGARRLGIVLFFVIYIGFGIALPLAFIAGNRANASEQIGGLHLTAAEKRGRILFGAHCGVCHTLAAANTNGKVGPNLDTLKPPASLVLRTINNGCLQKPASTSDPQNCLGQGNMPSQILQGKEAEEVAQFVGKVAGKE